MSAPTVGFSGMTHLGLVSASAVASRGFTTLCFDSDPVLTGRLSRGDLPVLEPGLNELLRSNRGRQSFTSDIAALGRCDVVYVALDVPTSEAGIPLGGNRRGPSRRYVNLLLTMLMGGLWHGAAWTFVAWGGLHGLYLIVNHAWHRLREPMGLTGPGTRATRWAGRVLTFLAVTFAWIFFRSESFGAALGMLQGMIGRAGLGVSEAPSGVAQWMVALAGHLGLAVDPHSATLMLLTGRATALAALLAVVFLLPNSQQLLAAMRPALQKVEPQAIGRWLQGVGQNLGVVRSDGSIALNGATGLAFASALLLAMAYQAMRTTSLRPFIYFQF